MRGHLALLALIAVMFYGLVSFKTELAQARQQCASQLHAFTGEQVARLGKTDSEWYAIRPQARAD